MTKQAQARVVPLHKSEKVFRTYEPIIFTILNRWPEPSMFKPDAVAATTFSARLRDAISSVIEFQWQTALDVEKLKLIWSTDLVITCDAPNGYVHANNKTMMAKALPKSVGKYIKELITDFSCEVDNPSEIVLTALGVLFSQKVLVKPAKITNPNPELLQNIALQFDVAFQEEVGFTVMI
jgi:hypothetical protein